MMVEAVNKYRHITIDPKFNTGRWMTEEESDLMRLLVKQHDIKYVVEIGTANGYSALHFAIAGATVHTHDIVDRPKLWDKPELQHLKKNITFYCNAFTSIALPTSENVLYFIDGDHSIDAIKKDYDNVLKQLKYKDIVVFHDTLSGDRQHKYWKRLIRELPSNLESEHFKTKNGVGLLKFKHET